MKGFILILCIVILFTFQNAQEPVVKIALPNDYTGWAYLIGTTKKDKIQFKNDSYCINSSGIGYIDTTSLNNDFKVEFYRNDTLLTDKQIKFLSTTYNFTLKRKLFLFYILNHCELEKDNDYWLNEASRRPIILRQIFHTDSLIQSGTVETE